MSQPDTPSPETTSNNTPSISAAAQTYLALAMQPHSSTPPATSNPGVLQMPGATRDVVMEDAPLHRPASPASSLLSSNAHAQAPSPILPPGHQSNAASPVPIPARTSTPVPKVNGNAENTSRATSQHPDTGPSLPTEASVHGAPARVYLNQTVTGSLLEGMKLLAKEQPKDPLRVLGEFLLSKSKELEGGN